MFNWFRNLSITTKATLLLSLTAIFFLLLLALTLYLELIHTGLLQEHLPTSRLVLLICLVLLMAVAFVVTAVWLSTRPIVVSLKRLSEHMLHLESRQGSDRYLEVLGNDEIGKLTRVLNEMLHELDDDAAAREEAQESQRQISAYMTEMAVWQISDGSIRFISDNCLQMTGYHDYEFYADPDLLEHLIHPLDLKTWEQCHHEYAHDGTHPAFDFRMIHKDSTFRWMRHTCHRTYDQQGQVSGRRGSFIDVTSLLQAQQGLQEEKKFVENMINGAATPMFVISRDHRVLYWNRAIEVITSCSQQEMIGSNRHWSAFYAEQRATLADFVVEGSLTNPEEFYQTFNPSQFLAGGYQAEGWYDLSVGRRYLVFEAAPIRNESGEIIAAIESLEDITGQKVSQEQLAEYRDQLDLKHTELAAAFNKIEQAKREWEQTLDHLQDFIILTDTEHHIKRFNKILADMTGMPLASLVGHDWRDLLQNVGFKFVNFTGSSGELVHLRSARSYDISIYPVKDASETLQGFVISLNDTTELRATTQELETALEELNNAQSQIYQQEKMASIGQLAAGVAHEINNPMGFITSNLGSLDKYVGRLSEYIGVVDQAMQNCCAGEAAAPVQEARKRLKIDRILDDAHQLIAESQDGAGRVRRIVQDLKSFSRVDQAETALIDLNEALETTINIAWNEIKYVADVQREFGDIPKVKCFPQQLNQVFLNLLVNAAHALGETRGTITVQTMQDNDSVLVKVSDTGCGMPEEVQRRIFEPFFTTKEVGKGTGLGLSISYDIIKKHGGSIDVQSEVGRGTVFTVRLPIEGQKEEA